MPVIGVSNRVPRPIGAFRVDKDNARPSVFLIVIGPHIEIAPRRSGLRAAGALKPWMLVRSMIDDKVGDNAYSTRVCLPNKVTKVSKCAVVRMNIAVIADIVTIVAQGRRIKWQQPDGGDAKLSDGGEL